MNKVYSRINWENEPSTKTPLNEHNLNKIDFAVDEIDNRVIELDSTKAKNTDLQTLSTRVDNLILNAGDSSAECADARVTEDGTTYDTLKNRLDAEHSNVTSDISQLSEEIVDVKEDLSQLKETENLDISYSEKNCDPQGFYPAKNNIKGLGFLMKNVPNFVHTINVGAELTGNGVVKLEILDYNKNDIFSTSIEVTDYSSGVKNLIFNVNEYILEEKIWIRIYSETIGIGRVEPNSLNEKIVDTSTAYSTFLVNDNWNYGSFYNYIPCCTINGFSAKKSIFVGEKHKFTKIKDAVDFANEHIKNGWDIFIESGTYDIYSEFGGDEWYSAITSSKGNMQGLSLGNNVSIIGIGNVKLTLNAPDNLATASNVPNLSAIELSNKNNKIENIEIECKNVRYGIHDETNGRHPNSKRYFKNIRVKHNGCVSGTWSSGVSYGCGTSDNSYFEYENCIFESGWLAHPNSSQTIPPNFIANNCSFGTGPYAVSLNTSGVCKANITFNNCHINYMIRILENSDVWSIFGSGNSIFNYVLIGSDKSINPLKLYDITRIFKNTGTTKISKGNAVSIYNSGVSNANEVKQVIGIALNNAESNEDVRVQLKGYYGCYAVSPFSANNTLLGVSNGAIIENTSNYFAIGVYVDDMQQIYLLN